MSGTDSPEGALQGIRVLDLAGPMGVYCCKLLADLGADVIKVEKPEGDPMRSLGPFYHDEVHPEKSLYFFHYNINKRSVTVNLESAAGKQIFKKLAESADIVVETYPPGYLDELGLGYSDLKVANPGLIMTSVTPFGQTGPYRDYKSSDLVGHAMGGLTNYVGNPGERPTWTHVELAYHHVNINASTATLIALYHRDLTSEGQYIDVSMHEAVSMLVTGAIHAWDVRQEIGTRRGMAAMRAGFGIFRCMDGYVYSVLRDGPPMKFLFEWLDEDGIEHDFWDERWQDLAFRTEPENIAHMQEILATFFLRHTKKELVEKAQSRHLSFTPYNDSREVVEDPHLNALDFFVDIEHPAMNDTARDVGAPYRLSETPWHIRRRPPLMGEHNEEIYIGELGYSRNQLALLKSDGGI